MATRYVKLGVNGRPLGRWHALDPERSGLTACGLGRDRAVEERREDAPALDAKAVCPQCARAMKRKERR